MKITKRQLRRIIKEEKQRIFLEMNPDGTISDDEDSARYNLLASVEIQIDELIQHVRDEAERIGGGFRSPGIRAEVFKLSWVLKAPSMNLRSGFRTSSVMPCPCCLKKILKCLPAGLHNKSGINRFLERSKHCRPKLKQQLIKQLNVLRFSFMTASSIEGPDENYKNPSHENHQRRESQDDQKV